MDIATILGQNQVYRLDNPIPSEEEIEQAEKWLCSVLPEQYKVFLRLGGLNDLRFNHNILALREIGGNRRHLPSPGFLPFASNGCGDLFCWKERAGDDPTVFYWEHESGEFSECASSFSEWLAAQRF
jgi:hypothetical protein